jgi:hypothetical protein
MKRLSMKLIIFLFITGTHISAQNSVKWEETFNDPTPPPGWQVIDADLGGSGLQLVASAKTGGGVDILPQTGRYFFTGDVNDANLAGVIDEWLISPRISVIYAGDSLYFWAGAIGDLFDDSLRILVSTTGNEISDFQNELGKFRVAGPAGTWHRYDFALADFDSLDIYFAINYLIRNGGPGGANSDFVWIDHPVITGDPGTLNAPPSEAFLQNPVNKGKLDFTSPTIQFKWSASEDRDAEPLTYTLTVVNVFPKLHFKGIEDTVLSVNWKDIFSENTVYRWTIETTDGKSRVASPDTFEFQLADPAAIAGDAGHLPAEPLLFQNYPNPFNPGTVISWQLAVGGRTEIAVYNILGEKVVTLVDGFQNAGHHQVTWEAVGVTAGIYICWLNTGSISLTRKMILLK